MRRASPVALAVLLLTAAPAAFAELPGPFVACEAVGPARPVCGFQNPEDLAPLPGDEALLVSEYGAIEGGKPGDLALLVLATDERSVLFRGGDAKGAPQPGWGDPTCPGPPPAAFSPHGIDLAKRRDGKLQLLVVQHGGRESIEFFEVTGAGSDWSVAWRGCVLAPVDASLNEVVALPDGGFLTSKMMSLSGNFEQLTEAAGEPSGELYEWSAKAGFKKVPGTRGALPNGVEVSPDGRTIFMNVSMGNELRRVDRASGKIEGRAEVPAPDNVTWSPDGKRLLVASLRSLDPKDFAVCQNLERGACPLPFAIVAVDPVALTTEDIYVGNGPPMGGGTVGLQVGDELFIGSFAGDRVLRVKLSEP